MPMPMTQVNIFPHPPFQPMASSGNYVSGNNMMQQPNPSQQSLQSSMGNMVLHNNTSNNAIQQNAGVAQAMMPQPQSSMGNRHLHNAGSSSSYPYQQQQQQYHCHQQNTVAQATTMMPQPQSYQMSYEQFLQFQQFQEWQQPL